MKKTLAIVLALVMILSLATTAFADETYSITINNETSGYTYVTYQIFAGDYSEGVLSNIVWGSGVSNEGRTALQTKYGVNSAAELAEKLTEDNAAEFAKDVSAYLTDVLTELAYSEGKYSATLAAAGYYLVKNTVIPEGGAYTSYILKVVGAASANHKGNVPTSEKELANTATSYDIGSSIGYVLTGTLPSNYNEYTTYNYKFTDTMSKGLTYNNDAKVWAVNDGTKTEITTNFTITPTVDDETGVTTLVVNCDNLKAIDVIGSGTEIVVEYSATLNEDALTVDKINNTANLEYSNNPYDEGTGTTTTDDVEVYTFTITIDKVDGSDSSKKLEGAEFVLKNESGKYYFWNDEDNKVEWVDTEAAATKLVTDENGAASTKGIAAGNYTLVEIKAPAGYNLLAEGVNVEITNADVSEQVQNNSGSTLPSTGGIGTTLFYIFGGILVVGAVVLLVTKKRMNVA